MRPDAMIVRLSQAGELERLAATSKFPIICAGEGGVHHPTQALLDAFTIMRAKQTFTGRVVAICGDVLRSRVANSGAELLKRLGAKVRVVAPEAMQPQDGFVDCERFTDLKTGIQGVDVIMALRTQLERTSSAVCLPDSFRLDHEIIKLAQPDVVVMHPGPMHRDSEITSELADDKRYSLVAEQVTNGVAVRMAVLKYCFGK